MNPPFKHRLSEPMQIDFVRIRLLRISHKIADLQAPLQSSSVSLVVKELQPSLIPKVRAKLDDSRTNIPSSLNGASHAITWVGGASGQSGSFVVECVPTIPSTQLGHSGMNRTSSSGFNKSVNSQRKHWSWRGVNQHRKTEYCIRWP